MSAAFERAFDEQLAGGENGELMTIQYRDEEAIYIRASHDRVTAIFSILFRDETDKIMAKVFLQASAKLIITYTGYNYLF